MPRTEYFYHDKGLTTSRARNVYRKSLRRGTYPDYILKGTYTEGPTWRWEPAECLKTGWFIVRVPGKKPLIKNGKKFR